MNPSSPSGSPARRPLSAQQAQEAPAPTLTDAELLKYKQDNLLNDDDYAIELRLQIAFYGEKLLNRARYEVDLLEREVVALASVFNEFLEEVKTLDSEINQLSSSINAGKLQAAQELDATIKQEVQVVVEQLRLVPQADIESVDVLYQNLDALQDNFLLLQKQIQTLQALGVKTDQLQKNLPALEKGIDQFGKSIESHQMSLLMGAEQEQHKTDYEVIRLE
jgi:hypothetical protein